MLRKEVLMKVDPRKVWRDGEMDKGRFDAYGN
jgi:hypothetical protein